MPSTHTSTGHCPASEVLEAFVAGTCSDRDRALILQHQHSCDRCRTWIHDAAQGEDLLSELRAHIEAAPIGPGLLDRSLADSIIGYEIISEIGRGGQGVVYEARQASTGRRVALKVLVSGALATQSERARFQREVAMLAALRHPNILTVHDSGEVGGCPYIVMELVKGRPIDATVSGRCSVREVVELMIKVCAAVAAAHARAVIHRDLKPSNIFVDEDREPRIMDFGLACEAGSEATAPGSGSSRFVGSLVWSSPEHVSSGSAAVDTRSDVYSLGVILYRLLAGCMPYDVENGTEQTIHSITQARPAPPSVHARGVCRDLDAVVLRALEKDPVRRYQSAADLRDDLRRALEGRAVEARGASPLYLIGTLVRRHRVLAGATIAAMLGLAASAATITVMYERAESARAGAEHERDQLRTEMRVAHRSRTVLEEIRAALRQAGRNPERIREELVRGEARARAELATDAESLAMVLSGIAQNYRQIEEPAEARRLREEVITLVDQWPNAHRAVLRAVTIAEGFHEAGENDLAERLLDRLPDAPEAHDFPDAEAERLRARLALARGDAPAALEHAKRAVTLGLSAREHHAGAIAGALLQYALSLEATGSVAADRPLRQALEVLDADPVFRARRRHAMLHDLGAILVGLGRQQEAIGPLEEALKLRTEMFGAESRQARQTLELIDDARASEARDSGPPR